MATLKDKFIKSLGTAGKAITPMFPVAGLAARGVSSLVPKSTANPATANKISNITQPQSSQISKVTATPSATNTNPTVITSPKTQSNLPPAGNQFVQNQMQNTAPIQTAPTMPTGVTETTQANPISTAKTSYIDAYKKYIESMKENEDIKRAKEAYTEFTKNKDTSLQNIQDQAIPLNFITGQQESVANRASIQEKNLLDKIGLAQESQKATIDSLKAGVDLEGKLLEQNKPIEVGGVLYQPQADGSYKAITSNTKASEGFTLSKDQVRYDAQGNVVASGIDSKTTAQDATREYRENSMNNINSYIDTALSQIKRGSTGFGSKALALVGGTGAKDLKSTLTTIKANIGFEALQAMREASKTGGALGQVAVQELEALQATLGSLDQSQSQEQLTTNLNKIKNHYQNAIDAIGGASAEQTIDTPDGLKWKQLPDGSYEQVSFSAVGKTSASIPTTSRLASVNNNPGNLRFVGQKGAVKGEGGFAKFASVEAGIKALENQIKLDASRGLTLAQFVNKFAPPTENNTTRYIQDVTKMTGVTPNTPISSIDIKKLTQAIAQKESGTKLYA